MHFIFALQSAGGRRALPSEEAEECSSYGTEESGDNMILAPAETEIAVNSPDASRSLNASIAVMDVVQATIVEKLVTIGRAIGTVQFDMSWMHDDVRGVQNAMQKLAENVSEMRGAHIEVERLLEQMSGITTLRTSRMETLSAEDYGDANAASPIHVSQLHSDDNEETQNLVYSDDVVSIQETQLYDNTAKLALNVQSSRVAAGGANWFHETDMSSGSCLLPCAQTRTNMYVNDQYDESQQCEYTCPSGNTPTPAASGSLWAQFTTDVRDLPAPTGVGVGMS